MNKLLLDSDVCLDVLTARLPFALNAARVLEKVESGTMIGYASAESFTNMYYVLRKLTNTVQAISLIKDLRKIIEVAEINSIIIDQALLSGWTDFEDAVQHFCAIQYNCDAIITRNTADYKLASIPVMTPGDFLRVQS